MKIRLLILAAVVFAASVEAEQVWVSPEPCVDVTELSRDLIRDGHKIVTLAPEGRLLVECGPRGINEERQGIASVEPYSVVIEKDQPEGRGFGVRISTEKDKRFRKVEKIKPNALSRERARIERLGKQPRSQRRSGHWVADTGTDEPVVVHALDTRDDAEIVNATEGLDPARPSYADNSISQYFPPIRSQGSGKACCAWAVAYYYSTYTQAKDEGLDASGGDNDNICSPAFMFNLHNGGMNEAMFWDSAWQMLENNGVSSWTLMPYTTDFTSWPTEAAWIDAINRRVSDTYSLPLYSYSESEVATNLERMKQHLANGNVAATIMQLYSNWYTNYPTPTAGVQNGVVFAYSGSYIDSHALTIVGYDDNKPYFDGTETKYGAFLLANSWGPYWGVPNTTGGNSEGFLWVAYELAATSTGFTETKYASDKATYRPELYMVAGINYPYRGYVDMRGCVGSLSPSPLWTSGPTLPYNYIWFYDRNMEIEMTDAKRIAVDMTDGIEDIAFPSVELGCKVEVASDAVYAGTETGTITSAEVFHDFDGDGTFVSVESEDTPLSITAGQVKYATISFSYP
jgi:C1A family cysteine protease